MNHAVFRRTAWLGATLCAAALLATEAMASECQSVLDQISRPTVSLRVDNDLFGGRSQDQGYTNGLLVTLVTLVSPNLLDYLDDPFLPTAAMWINRGLTWLQVDDFDQINMIASFGQGLFTPEDHGPSELTPDDRPYAAVLLFSVGYNARKGDHLTTNQLRLGMVGPSARGNEVQSSVHKVIGSPHFNGWDHQLRDEPVFQLLHERMRRHDLPPVPFARGSGLSQDMITHWVARWATSAPMPTSAPSGVSVGGCPTTSAVRHCARQERTPHRRSPATRTAAGPDISSSPPTSVGCSTTSRSMATPGRTAIASTSAPPWPTSARASR